MIADKYAQRNQKQNKSTLIMYLVTIGTNYCDDSMATWQI